MFYVYAVGVSRIIRRVTLAMTNVFNGEIVFPTIDRVATVKEAFYNLTVFPNVIRVSDGSLIPIKNQTLMSTCMVVGSVIRV